MPHTYIFVLRAHPVRGESHNQHNTTGEVATMHKPKKCLGQKRLAVPFNNTKLLYVFKTEFQYA